MEEKRIKEIKKSLIVVKCTIQNFKQKSFYFHFLAGSNTMFVYRFGYFFPGVNTALYFRHSGVERGKTRAERKADKQSAHAFNIIM